MFRGGIGPTEILVILGVVLLLFGGKKLPELARGSGKALRIFKTEISDLGDDDKKKDDHRLEAGTDEPVVERVTERVVEKKPEQG